MWNPTTLEYYIPQQQFIYVPYTTTQSIYYDHDHFNHYYYPPSHYLPTPPTAQINTPLLLPPPQEAEDAAPLAAASAAVPNATSTSYNGPAVGRPLLPNVEDTTVMIRNIPNRYNRRMLMEYVDGHCLLQNQQLTITRNEAAGGGGGGNQQCYSAYDFLYLPFDFGRRANKGYAFVNFTSPAAAWNFYLAANNRRWTHCRSRKVAVIVSAKLQGLEQLLPHFDSIMFPCDSDDFLPLRFNPPRDGSNRDTVQQLTVGRCRF